MYIFLTEFVAVFGRRAIGAFFETPAESSQVVKAGLKSNIRNRNIQGKQRLGGLDAFMAEIIVKCCIGMLLEKPGKMIFGKSDIISSLFQC